MWLMLVTEDVSHPDRSPLNLEARRNISPMSVTRVRSGASVAVYSMLDAP